MIARDRGARAALPDNELRFTFAKEFGGFPMFGYGWSLGAATRVSRSDSCLTSS